MAGDLEVMRVVRADNTGRKWAASHPYAWIVLLAAVAGLGGCSDDDSTEPTLVPSTDTRDISNDTGSAVDTSGDAESDVADTGSDADSGDTGVDVIRRVVQRGYLGEMPAENFVFNPTFSNGLRWSQFKVESGERAGSLPAYREMYPSTPASAAVYRIPAKGRLVLARVIGTVLLRDQPMEVSIWIGRPTEYEDFLHQVHLVGVRVDEPSKLSRVILEADGSGGREVGGRFWRKYTASVTGFFGHGYLMVQSRLEESLLVHAPVATLAEATPRGLGTAVSPEIRPITRLDRITIRHARREHRRHRPDPVELFRPRLPRIVGPTFR